MIIDTHVHLNDSCYEKDLEEVLKRARDAGVKGFIIPSADPKTLEKACDISHMHDDVFFAIGVHPYHVDEYDEIFLKNFSNDEKCIAVGECGLDYSRLPNDDFDILLTKQTQAKVFKAQISLAKYLKKPLIVHIRDASSDAKQILIEEKADEVGAVLHCYNANSELLTLANKKFYFGIGGVITFKNARKLLEVLPKIPRDKLIIETDAPYLTPMPYRGKRNEPSFTTFIASKIADVLHENVDTIKEICTQNSINLFGKKIISI